MKKTSDRTPSETKRDAAFLEEIDPLLPGPEPEVTAPRGNGAGSPAGIAAWQRRSLAYSARLSTAAEPTLSSITASGSSRSSNRARTRVSMASAAARWPRGPVARWCKRSMGRSINDVSMNEGNSGTTAFNFTVSLSAPQAAPVTVDFATADGPAPDGATAPGDYTSNSGTVTFAPGVTSQTVTVQVNGDTTVEPNETFNVNLSGATGNATITDAQGVGTIVNDDFAGPPPPPPAPPPRSGRAAPVAAGAPRSVARPARAAAPQ